MKSIDSLRALSYRPYRRLFIGASISNIGTWIESVSIGIYMQTETKQAVLVAGAMVAGFLPQAFMGFFSGSIADRFSRKRVLIINNIVAGCLAALLAFCVARDIAHPAIILTILFLAGILNSMSFPSWQAFLADIVPSNRVAAALSLMSAQWNLGRILGPALAAILISGNHYAAALSVNAASFLVVIVMLSLVSNGDRQPDAHTYSRVEKDADMSLLGGWRFILNKQSTLSKSYVGAAIAVFWASPFISLIPNVADEVFKYKNLGTSLFTTFQGVGALIVSVLITTLHVKFGPARTQQTFLFFLPFALILFAISPNLVVATPVALFFGVTYLGTLNGTMLAAQLAAPPYIKGRVSAVYMATIGVLYPISSIIQGLFVEVFNARILFFSSGILLFVTLLVLGFFSPRYHLPEPYDSHESTASHSIVESLGTSAPGDMK